MYVSFSFCCSSLQSVHVANQNQQLTQNVKETITQEEKTCSEAHNDDSGPASHIRVSLQQPVMALHTAAKFTDTSMIVNSEPENLEYKSDATFCDSAQQLSNSPSAIAEICCTDRTRSETLEDNISYATLAGTSFQPAILSPSVALFTSKIDKTRVNQIRKCNLRILSKIK